MTVTRWLWAERSLPARLARTALVPLSLVYRGAAAGRAGLYRAAVLATRYPAVPTIAVGNLNLTVGGSGKTPIAGWIASYYLGCGYTPGVVLRGYGGDEAEVHRRRVPAGVVVEDPDRLRGVARAVEQGARVVVLDDAYQRLDVGRHLNVVVVGAESLRAAPWTLPAGPWREGWGALRRADIAVVTRKEAGREAAERVVSHLAGRVPGVAVARLRIAGFQPLRSGRPASPDVLRGASILASAGIADPDTFAAQCRRLGAGVRLVRWRDHHPYTPSDIRWLLREADGVDYIVVTEKDATKLRSRWPDGAPEPLVAILDVDWEHGGERLKGLLRAAVTRTRGDD